MPHFQETSLTTPPAVEDAESRSQRLRVKNRRMRYLELHPEYFEDPDLELADPLLYDRTVRRFQSPAERRSERSARGFAAALEANIRRSEAKVHALSHPDPNNPLVHREAPDGSITAVEEDPNDRARGKDDGWRQWKEEMGLRFMQGKDEDFDYTTVDGNDEYDDRAEEDRQSLEEYLKDEPAEYDCEGTPQGETGVQDF